MTSTTNKNTQGDYYLEQLQFKKQNDYDLYKNSARGKATTINFAGNGLLTGQYHPSELTHHYADVESFLRGTRSTNLVSNILPVYGDLDISSIKELWKPKGLFIESPIKNIPSLNLFENSNVFIPSPLNIQHNSRPNIR